MNLLSMDRFACQQARNLFDAYIDNELLPETSWQLERHLHRCRECRILWEGALLLKRRTRNAMRSYTAPAGLRARLFKEIRNTC